MRDLIFKNLISPNSRKKDTVLTEVFEKDGVIAKTERRCFYFIKGVEKLDGNDALNKWLGVQSSAQNTNKRRFHILKEHNESIGKDKIICKITGSFYAIMNKHAYNIAFLYSFKVRLMKATLTN